MIPEPERDKNLVDKLRSELAGILNWALGGLADWSDGGLMPPAAVVSATADYRDEMDVVGAFIAEECVTDPDATIAAQALYEAYEQACEAGGQEALKKRTFGRRLRAKGYVAVAEYDSGKKKNVRLYRGIQLR